MRSREGSNGQGYAVRAARAEDASRIAAIHVRAWQVAYRTLMPDDVLDGLSVPERARFWEKRLAEGATSVLVAEEEGVDGWLAYGSSRDDDADGMVSEIYGLYVDPSVWGRGAGTSLWEEARSRLLGAGVSGVTLWVIEANARARRFYERAGFARDGAPSKELQRHGVALSEVRYGIALGATAQHPERG